MGEDKEKPKENEKDKKEEKDPKEKKQEEKDQGKESKPKEGKEGDPSKGSRTKDAKDEKNDNLPDKSPGGKEKKKDEDKKNRKKLQSGMVVKTVEHAFKIEKILGSGGFGDVYKVSLVEKESEMYALKTEYEDAQKRKVFNRLKIETAVLEDINRGKRNKLCFTKLIDKGTTPKFRFLVMELVSYSLQYVYKDICKKQMPELSVVYLMKETLFAITTLHQLGYIHRDIKPHNFSVGLAPFFEKRIYLIDFGIARKFFDANKQFVVPRKKVQFLGTLKYCSRACHQEKEQSVKDDLEGWAYMCLEFYEELPWQKSKEREDILKIKSDLFLSSSEKKDSSKVNGCLAEILKQIDKMTFTDDVKKTRIVELVDKEWIEVMKKTNSDENTPLVWEGKVMPESRPRKKNMANRVLDDEDSDERKKRDEKAKKRRENLARVKKIEEELLKVMKEIDDGDGPEDKKAEARRMARDGRRSDQRRRRSGGRKRRETFDDEDDYDDDDDVDDEEDSYEEEKEKLRRRPNRTKRSKYRDEDSNMRKKTVRKKESRMTNEGTFEDRRKSQKKRKNSKKRSSRRRSHRPPIEEKVMKMEDSPPRDNGKGSGKRSNVERGDKIDEMDGERKDSGKRSRSNGGTPLEGNKEKGSVEPSPSPSATPIDGSDKGKKK